MEFRSVDTRLVCFIALTMMRLIQRKIAMSEPERDAQGDLG